MKNSIITLLTDFGTKDHYVAAMKGMILGLNPRCVLVDISHQVSPHNIKEGAFLLANAYSSFPKGTIHLSVVDPGVGGPRNPILLVTQNYFFVGPDNGLFTLVGQREKVRKVVALTNQKYFSSEISHSFHGRDIFAPVAAHLSLGIKPNDLGYELASWVNLDFGRPVVKGKELFGKVFHIDVFGNLITDVNEQHLYHFSKNLPIVIRVGKSTIHGLKKKYREGGRNKPIALFGSGGFLEISVREGSAKKRLKIKEGDRVIVSLVG